MPFSRKNIGRHLYIIQADRTGSVKIGRSNDPEQRLKSLQTGNPHLLKLILVLKDKGYLETSLHRRLTRGKTNGGEEWFEYNALPELPDWIYDQLCLDVCDWWWTEEKKPPPNQEPQPNLIPGLISKPNK